MGDFLVHTTEEKCDVEAAGSDPHEYEDEFSFADVCDLITMNQKLVEVTTSDVVKSRWLHPILAVNLPYIDNVSLHDFAHISVDKKDVTGRFKDFLRSKFLDLKANEKSEMFETNLAKIGLEINEGIRSITSDLHKTARQRAFQITGAVIGAITAVLVAVNSAAFGMLPGIIGGGGGLMAIAKALQDYSLEKGRIEDRPYYYVWLLAAKSGER